MLVQIEFRTDTLANWMAANPVIAKGEPVYESDTGRLRIGDGIKPFSQLGVQTADVSLFTSLTEQAVTAAAAAQEAADEAVSIVGSTGSASETQLGVVQYATLAEAVTGTGLDRVVNPAGVAAAIASQVPAASTTTAGRARFATTTETSGGASAALAVTPAGMKVALDERLGSKADLVGGLVPTSQLPALAISDVFVVNTQAAMLALTAQRGDVAKRTDQNKSYILAAEPASTLANWVELGGAAGEPVITSGTAAQYWRGDKTWQTLQATVVAYTPPGTMDPAATTVKAALDEVWNESPRIDNYNGLAADVASLQSQVAALNPIYRNRLAADVTGPANQTYADIAGMSFPIGSSSTEEWDFEFLVWVEGDTGTDVNMRLQGPAGATTKHTYMGVGSTITTDGSTPGKIITANSFADPSAPGFGTVTGTSQLVTIKGVVKGGGTAGDVKLQIAQSTATANAPIVKAFSVVNAARAVS